MHCGIGNQSRQDLLESPGNRCTIQTAREQGTDGNISNSTAAASLSEERGELLACLLTCHAQRGEHISMIANLLPTPRLSHRIMPWQERLDTCWSNAHRLQGFDFRGTKKRLLTGHM